MKKTVFRVLAAIFCLASLIFVGVSIYWVHFTVWESALYIFYAAFFFSAAFFLMSGAIIFFNFSGPKKALRIVLNIALPVILVGGFLTSTIVERISFYSYVSFTPEKWKTVEDDYKMFMAESFLDQYDVKKMKMSEVIELLGEPTEEGGSSANNNEYGYYFRYECGIPNVVFAMDPYRLDFFTLTSDRENKVLIYRLHEA